MRRPLVRGRNTRVAVTGKSYRLSFWSRCVDGIGVWVQYFDAEKEANSANPEVALQVPQAGDWKSFWMSVLRRRWISVCRPIATPGAPAWPTSADFRQNPLTGRILQISPFYSSYRIPGVMR